MRMCSLIDFNFKFSIGIERKRARERGENSSNDITATPYALEGGGGEARTKQK